MSKQQKDDHVVLHIPKLYASNQQDMTLGKQDSSLLHKHSTVGVLPSNHVVDGSLNETVSIPPAVSVLYEAIIDPKPSYRSISLGSSSCAANAPATIATHLDEKSVFQEDVFIIDYVWQSFDLGNDGPSYCPLANKLNSNRGANLSVADECSYYPGHLLESVDLSDIHNSRHVNNIDEKLKPFVKTFQDTIFNFRLEA
jgi:hypothetical protein